MSKKIELVENNLTIGANEWQVVKTKEMLQKGRRYFGSSGASLTHQVHSPVYKSKLDEVQRESETEINPMLAAVGLEGEHKTSELLLEWIADKPEVVLVDSVHIKGYGKEEYNEETGTFDGGDTDHVLIIGNTVLIIDSKNWKRKKKYGINNDGQVTRSGKPFPGGKLNTIRASQLWARYLSPHSALISSIVVISSEEVYVVRDVNWWKRPYRLVTLETLIDFLDQVWEKIPANTKGFINVNLVASIAVNAVKPYDVMKELLGDTTQLLDI